MGPHTFPLVPPRELPLFSADQTRVSLWCFNLQCKHHDNTNSSPWLPWWLLYRFIALLDDESHHELIWVQLFPPRTKPFPLQGNTWYWFQISNKVQLISAVFITPLPQPLTPSRALFSQPQAGIKWSFSVSQPKNIFSGKYIGKRPSQGPQKHPVTSKNASRSEISAFLVKRVFQRSWCGYTGLWDVYRLGQIHHGLFSNYFG